jgi:ATP-dependent DNA ligase
MPRPLNERQALEQEHAELRGQIAAHKNELAIMAVHYGRSISAIVGKDPESPYVPGRTLRWLKVKQKEYQKEARGFYREG